MKSTKRTLWWWVSLGALAVVASAPAEPIPLTPTVAPGSLAASITPEGAWRASGLSGSASTQSVAMVHAPAIGGPIYSVVGEVMYQGVEGRGYLVMWNRIPGQGRYFTKTLNDRGPMGIVSGDADWRPFALPFRRGDSPAPDQLEIQLVLPGPGTVMIRNLRLIPDDDGFSTLYPGAWWTPARGRFVHGSIGVVFGLFGVVMGLASRRQGWTRFAVGVSLVIAGLGGVALVSGCVALIAGQPAHVLVPIWLTAVLGTVLGPLLAWKARQQRTEIELRRMQAHDLAQV